MPAAVRPPLGVTGLRQVGEVRQGQLAEVVSELREEGRLGRSVLSYEVIECGPTDDVGCTRRGLNRRPYTTACILFVQTNARAGARARYQQGSKRAIELELELTIGNA